MEMLVDLSVAPQVDDLLLFNDPPGPYSTEPLLPSHTPTQHQSISRCVWVCWCFFFVFFVVVIATNVLVIVINIITYHRLLLLSSFS